MTSLLFILSIIAISIICYAIAYNIVKMTGNEPLDLGSGSLMFAGTIAGVVGLVGIGLMVAFLV